MSENGNASASEKAFIARWRFAPEHAPHDFGDPIRDADAVLDVPFVAGQGEV